MKTIKAGALCDNAIIKCKGSVKNLSFPVFVFNGCRYVVVIGCDTIIMELLLSIWYSFNLVTSMKVNQKPADFVRKDARRTLIGPVCVACMCVCVCIRKDARMYTNRATC